MLGAFAELVGERGDVTVGDVGCGAGRLATHLSSLGLRVVGVDLSPAMAAIAARASVAAAAGDVARLPVRTGALGALLCWYSIINLPPSALGGVFVELARVTAPSAPVLVAFQCGEGERVDRETSYGRPVALTYFRHRIGDVADAMAAAGFSPYATISRAAVLDFESTPQAILLARR